MRRRACSTSRTQGLTDHLDAEDSAADRPSKRSRRSPDPDEPAAPAEAGMHEPIVFSPRASKEEAASPRQAAAAEGPDRCETAPKL